MRGLSTFILVFLVGLFSCKKDKLEGDQGILEGKWEWVYSIRTKIYYNGAPNLVDTITPAQSSSTYALEFSRKGRFYTIENDEIKENYRLVFFSFLFDDGSCLGSTFDQDRYYYAIYPDNDENNGFDGCVSSDSLTCYSKNFPFTSYKGATSIYYENFFKKVN